MKAEIKKCECVQKKSGDAAEYQDAVHGTGNRIHNPIQKKQAQDVQRYRCTVCSRIK